MIEGGDPIPEALAVVIELALYVCALWVLFFLSTFLHELGHALGYMLAAGGRRWHIRVGWGRTLLDTKRLTVGLLPFDGFFSPPEEAGIDTTAKLVAVLSGGPAVSLILVIALLLVRSGGGSILPFLAPGAARALIGTAFWVNVFILIMSLIPTRYFFGEIKGLETDGLQIIHALRDRKEDRG